MLFAFEDGTPIEPGKIQKWFKKWQEEEDDPEIKKIVFHELRNSSTSYRLRVSGGDMATVMDGNGHSSVESMAPYVTAFEEDQKMLIQLMEQDLYGNNEDKEVKNFADISENDLANAVISEIQKNPLLLQKVLPALLASVAQGTVR